jgi:hypothetical protein
MRSFYHYKANEVLLACASNAVELKMDLCAAKHSNWQIKKLDVYKKILAICYK